MEKSGSAPALTSSSSSASVKKSASFKSTAKSFNGGNNATAAGPLGSDGDGGDGDSAAAAAAAEDMKDPRKKYNIKQYRGLLGSIKDVKKSIEDERRQALERELALQARMKESEAEAAVVQKELSVQLRCAGRSYQQLLEATRELTEQLRAEEVRRVTEIEALEKQVKELKAQLGNATKPWRVEVTKRDLKITKLQEAAVDQEARRKRAEAAIEPVRQELEAQIKARDDKMEIVIKEIDYVRADYQKQLEEKDVIAEQLKAEAKKEKAALLVKMREIEEASSKIAGPYERTIKELENKVLGLQAELGKVDYKPLEEELRVRKLGYEKLVKDFRVKQQLNYENIEKMRAGFELTLERMDKKIQENENEHKRRLKPWVDLVQKREAEIVSLKAKIEEMKVEEKVVRKQEAAVQEELRKELAVAKRAEELARMEAVNFKKEVAAMQEGMKVDTSRRKIQLLQLKLDEVTKRCEATVRQKDRELKQKTDIITELQRRVSDQAQAREADDKEWDLKVQKKEEGYGIVCANLAFAEGQILEERKRTEEAREIIRRREADIVRLKGEHDEELKLRTADHEALEAKIRELEAEIEEVEERIDVERLEMRKEFEERYDFIRERYEDQVADLKIALTKREKHKMRVEKELVELRAQFERAREDWEDKQRELDIIIRGRDRQIVALKNEIEFINDSWEVKYNRLMGLFEKLQKKYEQSIGPNGPQEAYRRARDLKIENEKLRSEILELKEMIKKQKRQIRDLQLDYDILVKETADLIAEKERGMAEMVGDMAKLEARLRAEIELKERLVKEMTAEKIAVVTSFEGRIRQLEQQVEAMRFTDRQELLDTIDIWKRAYERACIERDELEDHYKALLDTKDKQVQRMAEEYREAMGLIEIEREKGLVALDECEKRWKQTQAKWGIREAELHKEIAKWREDLDLKIRELDRERKLVSDLDHPDPEVDVLRRELEEEKHKREQVEKGVAVILEENTKLRQDVVTVEERIEQAQQDLMPEIRWRDERHARMVREHDTIKEILQLEMLKAQESCREIEEQVRKFMNPFELELKEAEDKYAQSQAGLLKLSQVNLHLKQEILDLQEQNSKDVSQFEDQLAMAAAILKEVATLGALKSLSKGQINAIESALGVDLDGDGRVA